MNRSQRESTAPAAAVTADGAEALGSISVLPEQPHAEHMPGRMTGFARRHALFGIALLAGAVIRVFAMLGFRGLEWTPDSVRYVRDAVHLVPGAVRPSGYSFTLWLLSPLHSVMVVVAVQYAMGLAIGLVGYALLRRFGLPGWAATLAMLPVLLSAYALQLQHFLLSDTYFELLVMVAVALLMWWPDPPVWACGLTGLLVAVALLTRSEGTPLFIACLVFLIVKFAGWRTVTGIIALCAAFAIPVAGYAAWYDSVHGQFELSSSSGAFLYGRVATFADCAIIKPPAYERRLCPTTPVSQREFPDYYIWKGPLPATPGGSFGQQANSIGTNFAMRAITAQPLDYLGTVARSFWDDFLPPPSIHARSVVQRNLAQHQERYLFPAPRPPPPRAARVFASYDPGHVGLRVVQPYAGWVRAYQRYVVAPGPLLGVLVLAGLGGLIVAWRRFGGPGLLPWLAAFGLMAFSAAVVEPNQRYLVNYVPLLCVAAAMGVQQMVGAARRLVSR